ncbi:MAG: hypothetical protein ABIG61_11890 [Planctomycetota bacterium]
MEFEVEPGAISSASSAGLVLGEDRDAVISFVGGVLPGEVVCARCGFNEDDLRVDNGCASKACDDIGVEGVEFNCRCHG